MVSGLPVVTTMLPGFEHFIDPAGVLVIEPSGESIRQGLKLLAGDPDLRARLAASSLETARTRFGLGAFVDAYESLYRSLASRAG
jgi:glycosyltransferase involved in cell wall biosynthesis